MIVLYWCVGKVQLFWEGYKNVRNRPYGFKIYLVNVQTMRTIAQIFVAFSEKLNFKFVEKKNLNKNYLSTSTTVKATYVST